MNGDFDEEVVRDSDKEPYDLQELIERLEMIRDGKSDGLNHPKAFYTLALEIKKIKEEMRLNELD